MSENYLQRLNHLPDHAFLRELTPQTRRSLQEVDEDSSRQIARFNRAFNNIVAYLSFFFKKQGDNGWRKEAEQLAASFREALRFSRGIVVGSMAANFLDSASYAPTAVMDVIVPKSGFKLMEVWLLSHEFQKGDKVIPHTTQDSTDPPTVRPTDRAAIQTVSIYSNVKNGRKLRLFSSAGPPFEALLESALTNTVNCFDYEAAYSAYPINTFEDRLGVDRRTPSITNSALAKKYIDRGWTIMHRVPEKEVRQKTSEWWEGVRCLGDSKTLRVVLYPLVHKRYVGLLRANSWQMLYIYNRGLRLHFAFETFGCHALFHLYTIAHYTSCRRMHNKLHTEKSGNRNRPDEEGIRPADLEFRNFSIKSIKAKQCRERLGI
ncbi:hypothetical protein BJ165DRAFT_1535492 [Panaeolus papilionaceus]|nr:hypothetical protein BJ165DRAFT_1535492 [Panaeolus papilionaceus]